MNAADIWFTNPKLWVGALALAVPMLVHLLTRRTRRLIRFPSLRFLEPARASQSAVYRMRHWILWAVRTLVILFLLAAFLKPVYRERWKAGAGPAAPAAVVIVLDASASMGYQADGVSLFSRGKTAARNIIESLGTADEANLILAGAAPRPSFREPAASAYLLTRDLEAAQVTHERADPGAAIAEAARQLQQSSRRRKELHLVSDFQRSNWAAVNLAAVPDGVRLLFVPVGETDPANLYVSDLQVDPPVPAVNEEVSIVCRVGNAGSAAREAPLRLQLGDDALLERRISVAAGMTASETFRFRVRERGILEAVASLPGDCLAADDRRYAVIPVAERQRVLIVSDAPAGGDSLCGRVLRTGFDPFGDGRRAYFSAREAPSATLSSAALAGSAAVLVAGSRPMERSSLDALLAYLNNGGRVIWFLAGRDDADNLAALAERSQGRLLLPFKTGALLAAVGEGAGAVTLSDANFDHAVFARFRERDDLADVRFLRHFATERQKAAGQVLARFSDGAVAVALQNVGAGALLIANFSPAPACGDLARRAVFVPLLHEMVRGAKPRGSWAATFAVGEPCSATVRRWRPDENVRFTAPDGEWVSCSFDPQADATAVLFPATRVEGFHRIYAGGDLIGSVAVNVDRRESELAILSREELAGLASRPGQAFAAARGVDAASLAAARTGTPLWPYALLVAAAWLAVEQALGWVWR